MKKLDVVIVASIISLSLAGCGATNTKSSNKLGKDAKVTVGETTGDLPIGSTYASTPPRLVKETVAWGNTKKVQGIAWSDTKLFGPVPGNLQAKGDKECQTAGGNTAKGYHPRAIGVDGKPIEGGGFICA